MRRTLPPTFAAAICCVLHAARPAAAQADPAPAQRVELLDHAALTDALQRFAREQPEVAAIVPVGTSRGGRRIDALRLARGAPSPGRPAILVVASLDGPLAWTSGLVLDHARSLVARAATDTAVGTLLDTTTFYLVPRANPDAAEARFARPLAEVTASGVDVDTDRDGKSGEDAPADVDGDGRIEWMRWEDPKGEWVEDPTDPRALVKAERSKGQHGRWKLAREARDADGDEEAGEDPPHDSVVNRNFAAGWQEHAPEAGRFATDEPEARALADFVLLHKDIALVLTYGELDNLAEKPKAKDDRARRSVLPTEGIPGDDAELLAEIGRRWKALGGTSTKSSAKDAGTFQAWVQAHRGLWAVNLSPWSVPLDEKKRDEKKPDEKSAGEKAADAAGGEQPADAKPSEQKPGEEKKGEAKKGEGKKGDDAPKPSDDAKRLIWIDAHPAPSGSPAWSAWTAFEHPELGPVEIGGFQPYALVEPPESERGAIAERTLDLLIALGGMIPRATLVDVEAEDLGSGTWRIRASIENKTLLPLQSALGRRSRSVRAARVHLEPGPGAKMIAGARETPVAEIPGSRFEIEWLLQAPSVAGTVVVLDTDSAGTARVPVEVAR
jgi:hypothetical protein